MRRLPKIPAINLLAVLIMVYSSTSALAEEARRCYLAVSGQTHDDIKNELVLRIAHSRLLSLGSRATIGALNCDLLLVRAKDDMELKKALGVLLPTGNWAINFKAFDPRTRRLTCKNLITALGKSLLGNGDRPGLGPYQIFRGAYISEGVVALEYDVRDDRPVVEYPTAGLTFTLDGVEYGVATFLPTVDNSHFFSRDEVPTSYHRGQFIVHLHKNSCKWLVAILNSGHYPGHLVKVTKPVKGSFWHESGEVRRSNRKQGYYLGPSASPSPSLPGDL